MSIEAINTAMLALAEGEFTPTEWFTWWHQYEAEVEKHLSRGEFLRIKPRHRDGESLWRAVLGSQQGACGYLQDRQIPFNESSSYRDEWNKEFAEFCREEERKRKEKVAALKSDFPLLFEHYPKFSASLRHTYGAGNTIEAGATDEQIRLWEQGASISLPDDIKSFFKVCSSLRLEGIQLGLESIYPLEINKKLWWVLGEFWKEADGDLLLFQSSGAEETTTIYYYAHEENKIKKLTSGMYDLLEKKMAWFNRQ